MLSKIGSEDTLVKPLNTCINLNFCAKPKVIHHQYSTYLRKMKAYVLILVPILVAFLSESGLAQTKSEAVRWLNTDGELYLKDVTGNSSIHWDIDDHGTLKVTDHKAGQYEGEKVIRKYTYLNVYQLDPGRRLIREDGQSKELVLRCKPETSDCVKTRYYYTNTNFKTEASPSHPISLEHGFDKQRGKQLEEKLLQLIQLINGKSGTGLN